MNRHEKALKKLNEGTVIPAHPLALDINRKLDEKRQKLLTRYYIDAGVGGVAVAVHTTQFGIRDPKIALLELVLRIASQEIDAGEDRTGRSIVKIAGVCGDVSQAVRETELAQKLGYDTVLLSPGGLNDLTEEQMLERTKTAASIMPVMGFYLQPSVGGRVFSYDYWQRMCDIDGVIGIKCAPFNRYQTLDVVRAVALSDRANGIALYTGNDDNIVLDLITKYRFTHKGKTYEKGFVGGLLGHWAVWTRTAVELFERIKHFSGGSEEYKALLTLAVEITDTNAAFFDSANGFSGCIAGLHEVLRRQGLLEGIWCLNKDECLSVGQLQEINRVYSMYPHLNDDEFVKNNMKNWL